MLKCSYQRKHMPRELDRICSIQLVKRQQENQRHLEKPSSNCYKVIKQVADSEEFRLKNNWFRELYRLDWDVFWKNHRYETPLSWFRSWIFHFRVQKVVWKKVKQYVNFANWVWQSDRRLYSNCLGRSQKRSIREWSQSKNIYFFTDNEEKVRANKWRQSIDTSLYELGSKIRSWRNVWSCNWIKCQ